MRSLLPALLALALLACDAPRTPVLAPTPGPGGAQPAPIAPGLWKPSLDGVEIPTTPAAGALAGQAFRPTRVTFDPQRNAITFSEGEGSRPARQLIVFLFDLRPEERISIRADSTGGTIPQIHAHWLDADGETRRSGAHFGGFSLELELDITDSPGGRPGSIYLCLPDDDSSVLAGSFRARITE